MKHIESIQPEYAAEELERIVREEGDATASAALSRLLHNVTGCAIPPLATTPQSEVEELVPLCLSILRRHWTTPLTALGDGTTPMSLADLMRRLIGDRVDGNESLGIPPANANIPTAVSALLDRKIGGVPQAPDGMSLLHLLTETTAKASVTELVDEDTWDAFGASVPISNFPNVNKVTTHVRSVEQDAAGQTTFIAKTLDELNAPDLEYIGVKRDSAYTYGYYYQRLVNAITSEVVSLPGLKRIYNTSSNGTTSSSGAPALGNLPNCKRLLVENLKDIRTSCSGWLGRGTGTQCLANAPECLELITAIEGDTNGNNTSADYKFIVAPKLRKFIIGGVLTTRNDKGLFNTTSTDLVHLEIGGATCSLFMNDWSPTNALDASRTDLIEEGSTAQNNLEQFLSNFKTYIAQRLTDKGSGLTLTLSQAVRDAIQTDPEIVSIITSKGWTISPAPSV